MRYFGLLNLLSLHQIGMFTKLDDLFEAKYYE